MTGHVYWSDACTMTGGLPQLEAHDRTCDERYRFISGSVRTRVKTRVEQSVTQAELIHPSSQS